LSGKEILNSWKEISQYLKHDVRTCRRWEKSLGLPVRRYDDDSSRSRVFAIKSELDEWIDQRKNNHRNSITMQKSFFRSKRSVFFILLAFTLSTAVLMSLLIGFPGNLWQNSADVISLGIYPFESANSSGSDDYLAQGITDEVIDYLALFENLKITKLAFLPNGQEREFYKNYGQADYFLIGDIQRARDGIRFRFNLTKAKNNKTVIEHEFHKKYVDIQFLKKAVARKIHSKLNLPFDEQKAASYANSSISHEPYDLYLKGNYILNSMKNNESDPWKLYHKGKYYYELTTRESNEFAIELFSAAIELDEHFKEAYVGLAQCYINYVNFGWDSDTKWLDEAYCALSKIESSPFPCPEYYSSLAKLYLLKYVFFNEETETKAFDTLKQGLESYPNYPDLNSLASYYYYIRYSEEGTELYFNKALEYGEAGFLIKPFSLSNLFFANLLLLDGQFSRALDICELVKKVDNTSLTDFRIGEIYYYMGNLERSESVFMQMESPLHLKVGVLYYLGMIASQNKNTEKVKNIISKIDNLPKPLSWHNFRISSMYFGIDDKEEGIRCLSEFFSEPNTQALKYSYKRYILIDRNFDKYKSIIRRMYFE
jgi:TolB-like protein